MKLKVMITVLSAVLILPLVVVADDTNEEIRRDLFAVITLQGHPCGKVIEVQRLNENDYLATCQTGDRYRVNVVAGRVNVEKN